MNFFMTAAHAAEGAQSASNPMGTIFMFAAIGAIFYFLLIRPQQKKQKEHQSLVSALKKGDKIVTIGGICGEIVNIKENKVTVKTGGDFKMDILKSAVSAVVNDKPNQTEGNK